MKALGQILFNKGTILNTVFLHPIKPILSFRVVSLLPELLQVEVCRFSEVIFRRVPYFVVEE